MPCAGCLYFSNHFLSHCVFVGEGSQAIRFWTLRI